MQMRPKNRLYYKMQPIIDMGEKKNIKCELKYLNVKKKIKNSISNQNENSFEDLLTGTFWKRNKGKVYHDIS